VLLNNIIRRFYHIYNTLVAQISQDLHRFDFLACSNFFWLINKEDGQIFDDVGPHPWKLFFRKKHILS
jgi:hypothetical protein